MKPSSVSRKHRAVTRALLLGNCYVTAVMAVALGACLLSGCGGRESHEHASEPYTQGVYVWQRLWTPEVVAAVKRAAPRTDCFMVLAGELERSGDDFRCVWVKMDWRVLGESEKDVWLVFRACYGLLGEKASPHVEGFIENIQRTLNQAKQERVTVRGIQLDYDCPTSELRPFTEFLRRLYNTFPETALSITALPTWMQEQEFRRLVRGLDHFVLQVHGLNRPRRQDDKLVLCATEKIGDWVALASRSKVPFYVALPTYGYRVYFDDTGAFASVGAETRAEIRRGWTYKDIHSSPEEISQVVRELAAHPPSYFRGMVWFRLPVASDAFNWRWETLEKVMVGESPTIQIRAEIRTPREDLFEMWVQNLTEYQPPVIRIPITGEGGAIRASDAVNGFRVKIVPAEKKIEVSGPAPAQGDAVMAAWWVADPAPGQQARFSASTVEVTQ